MLRGLIVVKKKGKAFDNKKERQRKKKEMVLWLFVPTFLHRLKNANRVLFDIFGVDIDYWHIPFMGAAKVPLAFTCKPCPSNFRVHLHSLSPIVLPFAHRVPEIVCLGNHFLQTNSTLDSSCGKYMR